MESNVWEEINYPENLADCTNDELRDLVIASKRKINAVSENLAQSQGKVNDLTNRLDQKVRESNTLWQELHEKYISALLELKTLKRKSSNESETVPKLPRIAEPESSNTEKYVINQPQQVTIGDVYNANQQQHVADHSSEVSKFKEKSISLAKEIAGEIQLPIELHKAVKAVSLQISRDIRKASSVQTDGRHYIRQSDLKKMVCCPAGNIQIDQIFQCAYENATEESKRRCTTLEAKKSFIAKHGNSVLVIGQAGIGKTTLTKIVAQMAVDKQIFSEMELVLYVRLSKVDFETNGNLIQLITTKGLLDSTALTTEEILALIKDNSKVLVIFDGVDEAKVDDLSEVAPTCSHDDVTKPSILVRNLMSGDLLPNAKILWTCRPRQAYELHESHRPHTILQILGLARDAQEDLGNQICQENWPRIKKHLLCHPDIFSSCYVPAICIITMAALNLGLQDELVTESSLQSITEVLVYALACYTRSDHMRGKVCDLLKVAKLAWNGFINKNYVFTEADFLEANLDEEAFQAFLITYVDPTVCLKFKLLEGDKCSSFSHLMWQEILAAVHFIFSVPIDEFHRHLTSMGVSHWEVVSKFVFGLCNRGTRQQLTPLMPSSLVTLNQLSSKKDTLQAFVVEYGSNIQSSNTTEQCAKLLQVSAWLREVNCPEISKATIQKLPEELHLSGTFFPTDAMCISYLLDFPDKNWKIYINNIVFAADSCSILFNAIKRNKCKTPMLYLGFNELENSVVNTISESLNGTDKLWMVNCSMTATSMQALQTGIQGLERQMKFLFLNNNPIGDAGATALSCCLWNLQVLNLNGCNVTTIGVESLCGAIKHLTHKIQLNLRNNNVGDSGVVALADCISCIYYLDINNCKISGSGIVMFATALDTLDEPMELINMGNNAIGDQGVYALSKYLTKVKELWIKDGGITETGVEQMTKCHSELQGKKPKVYLGQIPGLDKPYVDLF